MANPAKPIELKRKLGNPGKERLPEPGTLIELPGGYREPLRPLEFAGRQLWDSVFGEGELWVSSRTDVHFLMLTCEQIDRREELKTQILETQDWHLYKQLNDLERMIATNLGLLGFTPADRTRLGLAEVKRQSKLEEMMARRKTGETRNDLATNLAN
jgi:hypothetical protein